MADSQEQQQQQLRDALRIVAEAASRGKLGHGFSLNAGATTATASNGNANGEAHGTGMSPQRQNPYHAAALHAASLMHAGTNGTQGRHAVRHQQRYSQHQQSRGHPGTDGAGHALGSSLVSAMQPQQTLTDEDYEFLSSLQQPLLVGVGEGGEGSGEFYGGVGAPTSAAALSAGAGMYNNALGADMVTPGGAAAAAAATSTTGRWQTASSGHAAAAGALPHLRAAASTSTPGWQGQGRFDGSSSQLGLPASAAAYDLPPWLTELAAGAGMSQGHGRSHSGFAQGHHGQGHHGHGHHGHGHSQTPSLSLGGTSPASSSITGGGSEYSYTRTQLPNFMGSIALHSRGSPATEEAMLGAPPADSPSTASVASAALLARHQTVAARAPPPDLQPSFSMQDNHLWAGLDTDEHITTPMPGAAAAAGEALGGLGLDLNLDDYDLPLMPAGDLPDLDRQPADWLLTDMAGPAEWTEFDDDLAGLEDSMNLGSMPSHTGGTPASSALMTPAPADGGHRALDPAPFGGLWDASLAGGGGAYASEASSTSRGGGRDLDVDLHGMPPLPPAAATARAAAKRYAREGSDGGEGSSDGEDDDGGDDDNGGSGSKRAARSSRSTKAKRTRTRKRRLASDLPPDELAKMREINRNAAKRHRAMARGRSRVRQHDYEMSEKRLLQTQADMRDLKMQLTTLRRLVLEMYGPGGPRTLAFLQSGSNASYLGI
jgi:hypothetical protein